MRWTLPLVMATAVLLAGCKDEGVERLGTLRKQYYGLVEGGVSPRDPKFDPVLDGLRAIPADSDASAEARELVRRIEAARALPPKPLATPDAPQGGEELAKTCEALARRLGTATGAERQSLMEALARCRRELEEVRAHSHPPGEHLDAHPPGSH